MLKKGRRVGLVLLLIAMAAINVDLCAVEYGHSVQQTEESVAVKQLLARIKTVALEGEKVGLTREQILSLFVCALDQAEQAKRKKYWRLAAWVLTVGVSIGVVWYVLKQCAKDTDPPVQAVTVPEVVPTESERALNMLNLDRDIRPRLKQIRMERNLKNVNRGGFANLFLAGDINPREAIYRVRLKK